MTVPTARRTTSLYFFFSSRRRHTRFDCDWSSDVCSSDLMSVVKPEASGPGGDLFALVFMKKAGKVEALNRSEERRVGKECRSRWWAYHQKKKRVAPRRCGRRASARAANARS